MERPTSVWSIVRELHRAAQIQRRAAARSPLGPVATGVLNLAAQRPVRPKTAAAELDVPAQSITRAVSELVGLDLVRRVEDADDGRGYTIEVTEHGARERARFRDELIDRFSEHLATWTDDEVSAFAERLSQLVSALADDLPAPATARGRNPWRSR